MRSRAWLRPPSRGGAIIGVAITTAAVARSSNEGVALGHAFFVFAAFLVLMVPMVFLVPDRMRRKEGEPALSPSRTRLEGLGELS